jgi:predicted amidohydrolase YtcJ
MYANTALLNKAGYDIQNEADSQASFFVRRSDGSLTGEMRELAMTKASLALPKPDPAHIKKALDRGIQEAHSAGVTSLQEPSANSVLMRALAELERQGALKMVVFTHVVDAPEHLAGESRKDLHALIETVNKFESPHVHTDYIKFMLDGVPVPPLYTQCDLDSNGQPDESKVTVPDLVERILHHDAAGRTVKIHATGHGSVRMALDAISQARKQNPGGPKHEIAHCNSVHEEDYARFQQLNVTAEMSPAFFFMHPAGAATPELFDWNFPKFMERNAHITIGSDWGGTFDLPLFQYLDGVVERVGDGFRERGGERLLRMITLAGAEAVGKGDQFGSIEVGKKANFIVVDKNLSKGEFAGAKVLKTWFEGELVFDGSNK